VAVGVLVALILPYVVYGGRPEGPGYPTELYGFRVSLASPDLAVTDIVPRKTRLMEHELRVDSPGWSVHFVPDWPPVVLVHAVRMSDEELAVRNLWAVVLQEGAGRIFMPDEFVEGGVPGLITGIAGQAWAWKHLKWARKYGVIHGLRRYAREVGPSRVSREIRREYGKEPWRALLDFCEMMRCSDVGRFLRSKRLSFRDFLTSRDPELVAQVLTVLDLGRLDPEVAKKRIRYVLDARAYPLPKSEEWALREAARRLLHG